MAQRKLLILAGILVALGLIAYLSSRPSKPALTQGMASGDVLLESLDLNAIVKITIASSNATVELARKDGIWVAESLFDYPVDFEKLRGQLTALPGLKIGQLVRGGESMLEELGLDDDRTTVTLMDESGSELAALQIGETRSSQQNTQFGGMPAGHYVRMGEGPVAIVADSLSSWTGESANWIKKQLFQVSGPSIHNVSVTHPDGSYDIRFPGGASGEVSGLQEGETTNTGNAGRLQRALSYLSCQSVADPALSDEDFGLDDTIVYRATDEDGLTYTAHIGAETDDDGRYARFDVSYEEPEAPTRDDAEALVPEEAEPTATETTAGEEEDAETAPSREERIDTQLATLTQEHEDKVKEVRERVEELSVLKGWTYVLASYSAGSMILPRAEVVDQPEPPEAEEGAETGTESAPTTTDVEGSAETESTSADEIDAPPAVESGSDSVLSASDSLKTVEIPPIPESAPKASDEAGQEPAGE